MSKAWPRHIRAPAHLLQVRKLPTWYRWQGFWHQIRTYSNYFQCKPKIAKVSPSSLHHRWKKHEKNTLPGEKKLKVWRQHLKTGWQSWKLQNSISAPSVFLHLFQGIASFTWPIHANSIELSQSPTHAAKAFRQFERSRWLFRLNCAGNSQAAELLVDLRQEIPFTQEHCHIQTGSRVAPNGPLNTWKSVRRSNLPANDHKVLFLHFKNFKDFTQLLVVRIASLLIIWEARFINSEHKDGAAIPDSIPKHSRAIEGSFVPKWLGVVHLNLIWQIFKRSLKSSMFFLILRSAHPELNIPAHAYFSGACKHRIAGRCKWAGAGRAHRTWQVSAGYVWRYANATLAIDELLYQHVSR